jgi:2'-5' RNA ligase
MPRGYISAQIENELQVRSQRDIIWNIINASRYYKKVDPHITVIPPFTVKEGHEEDVKNLVEQTDIQGQPVKMEKIDVYENIDEPYVVLLRVDVDIHEDRNWLMEKLPEHTKGNMVEPVTPHITLFKTLGFWDKVPDKMSEKLKREIESRPPVSDTKIRAVEVEFN